MHLHVRELCVRDDGRRNQKNTITFVFYQSKFFFESFGEAFRFSHDFFAAFALRDNTNFVGFDNRIEINDGKAGTIEKVGNSVFGLKSAVTEAQADRYGDSDGQEGDFHRIKRKWS